MDVILHLEKEFKSKIRQSFGKSPLLVDIKKAIEESRLGSQHKKLDKIKSSKIKISAKYFPASKKKELIFLVEGDSAVGALNQKRDIKTMSSYAMKGKIANIKKVSDILKDTELTELITILGLDIKGEKKPKYEKIVIAADSDVDGMHVSSLILNFFYTWFQNVIRDGHLYELTTPLVTAELGKKKYYFYYMHEWEKAKTKANYKNIQYHKGLGSLTEEDWTYVFENDLNLVKFVIDDEAEKNINLIFREEAKKRKEWMSGEEA
jgi:DNA gyrase/topoisomerase IV subunit B